MKTHSAVWDHRFLALAETVANWSKGPGRKVGAVLVRDREVLGMGYNGLPSHIEDTPQALDNPDPALVQHAEMNAVRRALQRGTVVGSTLYCTYAPCEACMRYAVEQGVARVVVGHPFDASTRWFESQQAARGYAVSHGVRYNIFTRLNLVGDAEC